MVEGIHGAIVAFLRTSEQGVWTVDTEQQSDEFNMHFIRGNWRKTLFGAKRVAGYVDVALNGTASKPMLLSVTIRPAPRELRIGINHSVFYPDFIARSQIAKHTAFWQGIINAEVKALSDYLHQFFDLETPPNIESG